MSNFHPTVGRNVQYISTGGNTYAGVITQVNNNGTVTVAIFSKMQGLIFEENVRQFVVGARPSDNINVYLLHWQNR